MASDTINNPDLDPSTLQPRMRALKDAGQAWELVKALENENKERNKVNGRIMDKYNAERPYNPQSLEAEGLSWRNNFSTKPLPQLIDKVAPRFVAALKSMRYITSAAFPENIPGASVKTEKFREEITKVCRSREGWNDLWSEVAQENALFGFTSVSWQDEDAWLPKHFRQDAFFVPRGTKHFAGSAQIYICRDEFLLHELFQFIKDPQAAALAGWNIENTVTAINEATPEGIRSKFSDTERQYADLNRELTVGSSFTRGAKAVCTYSLFVTEITGQVSHYILEGKSGKELFRREDRFPSMADCVAFFSFQHGNGKLQGSKGIGREIYNLAGALDRSRNEVMDRLQMAGKIVVSCDEKQIKRFRMSVVGSAIVISNQFAVQSQRIDGAVEPFLKLDDFYTKLLDQIAGTTSPKALEGDRVTRAQVELLASREEEGRDNVMERFLSQFVRCMNTIQRRLCRNGSPDPDAKAMQERLLQVMSRKELDYIASQPAAETVADYSEQERQQIILVSQEGRGNPLYNQKELERRKLTAQVNADFADAVLLPDNDPTETAEQGRTQQLENILLSQGQEVPVSPRDNFEVHFAALEPLVMTLAQAVVEDPNAMLPFNTAVSHANAHLELAKQSGANAQALQPFEQKVQAWTQALMQLQQHEEQAAQVAPGQAAPAAEPAAPAPEPAPAPAI